MLRTLWNLLFAFALATLPSVPTFAQTYHLEIHNLHDLVPTIPSGSRVFVDLDLASFKLEDIHYGTDQSFTHEVQLLRQLHPELTLTRAKEIQREHFKRVNSHPEKYRRPDHPLRYVAVEPTLVEDMLAARRRGVIFHAITARHAATESFTLPDLEYLGFPFDDIFPGEPAVFLAPEEGPSGPTVIKGVAFVGEDRHQNAVPKGEVLEKIFARWPQEVWNSTTHIYGWDDKDYNAQSLQLGGEHVMSRSRGRIRSVRFFRYTGCDALINSYDPVVARIQEALWCPDRGLTASNGIAEMIRSELKCDALVRALDPVEIHSIHARLAHLLQNRTSTPALRIQSERSNQESVP